MYEPRSPVAWVDRKTLADMRAHASQAEGYRLTHDKARREFALSRVGEKTPFTNNETSLFLVLYTPNPVGEYSGVDCFWVDAAVSPATAANPNSP